MQRSNELFLNEQRGLETIKRLARMNRCAEQHLSLFLPSMISKLILLFNSQILDLLLDINDSPQLPADKRFNLTTPHADLTPIPPLVTPADLAEAASNTTAEGKAIYAEILALYNESEATKSASASASKSLAGLMTSTPHLSLKNPPADPKILEDIRGQSDRYMTLEQIDQHLFELDSLIAGSSGTAPAAQRPQQVETAATLDLSLDNPHSVYNWLRNNKPQVFLQDGEGSEKSSGKPGALRGAGKRIPQPAPSKPDVLEFVEEDGAGYDGLIVAAKTGGKRKRGTGGGDGEDDGGYHPKAGRVEDGKGKKARQPRKKKEDGGGGGSARKRVKSSKFVPVEPAGPEGSEVGGD